MFTGYTPETIDFLWGIRLNNNREWFLEHKQQYTDTLYHPTKELAGELFQPFLDKSGTILKVSRIYRDARLHHPLPYKESLWLCIRQDVEWWAENPCLFFEINPDGIGYGFSLWRPRPATMEQFRREITNRPDEFLETLAAAEAATGLPITAQCYKRPKPTDDPRLEPFFAWKSDIGCIVHEDVSEAIFGSQLKDRVGKLFTDLAPVYDYFTRFRV